MKEKNLVPMSPFSEYALLVEDDDYPKPEILTIALEGKMDPGAFAESYEKSLDLVPIFTCNLIEKRVGGKYIPFWTPNREVKNRMVVEDCRHMAGDPFDLNEFNNIYFAQITRRRIDLKREFPFRTYLLRIKDDLHILALVFHHSAMDPFKGYLVMTNAMALYHEKVTGAKPLWAGFAGSVASARKKALVKPLPFMTFAKEQLMDVWVTNRASVISPLTGKKVRSWQETKGRHCIQTRFDDPKLIQALVDRAINIDCTFNDLLLAVARKTFTDWNRDMGKPADRFRMMLATSLIGRADLSVDSGAALGALNFISANHENADLDAMIKHFGHCRASQLKKGIDVTFYNTLNNLIKIMRILPLKTRIRLLRGPVERIPCTASLSNTGSIWPKSVDKTGRQSLESAVTDVGGLKVVQWNSNISIARNLGVGLTCRTYNKTFFFDFVYDRFRFKKEEARELTKRYVENMNNSA